MATTWSLNSVFEKSGADIVTTMTSYLSWPNDVNIIVHCCGAYYNLSQLIYIAVLFDTAV